MCACVVTRSYNPSKLEEFPEDVSSREDGGEGRTTQGPLVSRRKEGHPLLSQPQHLLSSLDKGHMAVSVD